MFLQSREEVPKSVTFVVFGATVPPAMWLLGSSVMLPVVEPPMVNGLKAVVWIDLAAPASVNVPDTEALLAKVPAFAFMFPLVSK